MGSHRSKISEPYIQMHNLVCILHIGGYSYPKNKNLNITFGRLLMDSLQPEECCHVCKVP